MTIHRLISMLLIKALKHPTLLRQEKNKGFTSSKSTQNRCKMGQTVPKRFVRRLGAGDIKPADP